MNLVKMARPTGIDTLKSKNYKEKIVTILDEMNTYKTELQAHAYFVDVKLSVIKKEMLKPTATKESLAKIGEKLYTEKTTIEVPTELQEKLKKFKIKFDNKDKIDLITKVVENKAENELSM